MHLSQRIPTVEVTVSGAFDSWSAPRIHEAFEQAISLQPQLLVIDLTDCQSIDAAGILLLLDLHRRAIREGGAVALRGPSERLRRNLRLAHVDRVLTILTPAATVEDAAK